MRHATRHFVTAAASAGSTLWLVALAAGLCMFAPSADGQQHVGTRGEAAVAGSPSVDLQRRMRHNEYAAVLACLTYVDAQNKYAARDWTGSGVNIYAQRIVSTPGRKDGLYWPAADGDESPPDKFMR